jgi:6-phosphofructokinase 2
MARITSTNEASLIEAGCRLFDRYRIEVIALSMGPDAPFS